MAFSFAQLPNLLSSVPGLRRSAGMPIGLDLGQGVVRMVQLANETVPGEPPRVKLIAAQRRELRQQRRPSTVKEEPGSEINNWQKAGPIVAELLRRGGFCGRRVVAALPRSMQMIKTLRLPTNSSEEMPALIAAEARHAFGVDLADGNYVVHFLPGEPLRRANDQQQEGLLAIARKADLNAFVTCLHEWGALVDAVDFAPIALYRGMSRYGRRERDRDDVHVLVDVGRMQTQVVIGRGSNISFHKNIAIGGQTLNAAVARKLGLTLGEATVLRRRLAQQARLAAADLFPHAEGHTLPDETKIAEQAATLFRRLEEDPVHRSVNVVTRTVVEDLAREISLCLRYYSVTFRSRPPEMLNLCGGVAEDPVLCARLRLSSSEPIRVHDPLADVAIEHDRTDLHQPGQWSLATGLALRDAPFGIANLAGMTRKAQQAADERVEQLEADTDVRTTTVLTNVFDHEPTEVNGG